MKVLLKESVAESSSITAAISAAILKKINKKLWIMLLWIDLLYEFFHQ